MTNYKLEITDKAENSVEVYLNKDDNIYIGEVYTEDSPYSFFLVLTKEDWTELKSFIDKEFKKIENPF